MNQLLVIFIGGGLGSLTRYGLGRWIDSWHEQYFPYGTFVVNIIACFILGLVVGLADQRQVLSDTDRLFWAVGFCGGFSTFSTFSHEALTLFQQGQHMSLALYIIASVAVCVLATFGGMVLAGRI